MAQVLHKHVYKRSAFGGTKTTTLCGRVRNNQEDYNMADTDDQVTCKFCLARIAQLNGERK